MNSDYYVYLYLDPTKETACHLNYEPFYVGRGRGNRDRHHMKESEKYANASISEITARRLNINKIRKINKLVSLNKPPIIIKIGENLTLEESKELEVALIQKYGRSFLGEGPLVNLTSGGEGRVVCHAGPFNPFYGKTVSSTHRKKLSDVHRGKKISEKQKEKISNALKGKKNKLQARINKSIAVRKTIERTPSAKQFQQLGNIKRKTWKLISPDGKEIITTSLPQTCKILGLVYKTLLSAYRKSLPLKMGKNAGWKIEQLIS